MIAVRFRWRQRSCRWVNGRRHCDRRAAGGTSDRTSSGTARWSALPEVREPSLSPLPLGPFGLEREARRSDAEVHRWWRTGTGRVCGLAYACLDRSAPSSRSGTHQVHAGRCRRGSARLRPLHKGNFQFEQVVRDWRNTPILDLRLKK
jgi:hypothetical protein